MSASWLKYSQVSKISPRLATSAVLAWKTGSSRANSGAPRSALLVSGWRSQATLCRMPLNESPPASRWASSASAVFPASRYMFT